MNNDKVLLLVDDDPEDQEIFDLAIEKVYPPIKLLTARDGEEAIRLLLDGEPKPDCIFLDLNMPRMNGKQFLHSIKKYDHLSHIPIIIYSTSSSTEDRTETSKLGAATFITKPDSVHEIAEIVADVLQKIK